MADFINHWGGVTGIIGATATLLSVIAVFWASGEREKHFLLRIETIRAEAAKANEGVAIANARAEEFGKEAAEARLETERLRHKFQWRTVSPEQAKALASVFSEFRAKYPMNINMVGYGGPEVDAYTAQIVGAMQVAYPEAMGAPQVRQGKHEGRSTSDKVLVADRPEPQASALRDAFHHAGFKADLFKRPPQTGDFFYGDGELVAVIRRNPGADYGEREGQDAH